MPKKDEAPGNETGLSRSLVVGRLYLVRRGALAPRPATVLNTRLNKGGVNEAYISFPGEDKRLDSWIRESEVGEEVVVPGIIDSAAGPITSPESRRWRGGKDLSTPTRGPNGEMHNAVASSSKLPEQSPSVPSTPEREHAAMTRVRNFEDVRFGEYLIKTWYYSPYPLPVEEAPHAMNGSPLPHVSSVIGIASASSRKRKLDAANGESSQASGKAHEKRSAPSRSVSDMFTAGVGKGSEGGGGRLWVCDLCFKYMRTRAGWNRHTATCDLLQPPGRKVYQRGSYTIWEVDGAQATLYCQNLSLFGKLFIDHKSVFFHVENFLFYVLCDAATSRRDQVMAFFSKEKLSYDDYNLACIVTFPPCQNRGFGRLLIEFSYYLTLHPSTRPASLSPGTPERPLSDLGLKGYTVYWVSVVLRFLRRLLVDAPPIQNPVDILIKSPIKPEGRTLRRREPVSLVEQIGEVEEVNGVIIRKNAIANHKGQYAIALTLQEVAKACHLRVDDTAFTLGELGLLRQRRTVTVRPKMGARKDESMVWPAGSMAPYAGERGEERDGRKMELGEWRGVEVVVTWEAVSEMWVKWRVKEKGMLDNDCVLL